MKASLIHGLAKDAQQDVRGAFLAALPFRKQIIKILEHKIDEKRKKMCREETIQTANWDVEMAYYLGYEKAQRELISLMSEKNI